MLSLNNHIKTKAAPSNTVATEATDCLCPSNNPAGAVVCETHAACEIKVLTNVISEGREEFYNLSTTYSTVHKLFLVCGKQNKTLLLLRVKRLQFGNDSLLFPQ